MRITSQHCTVYHGPVNLSGVREAANPSSAEAARKINAFVNPHIMGIGKANFYDDKLKESRKIITTNMLYTLRIALKSNFANKDEAKVGLTVDADRLKKYFTNVFSDVDTHEVDDFVDNLLTLFAGDRTSSVLNESFDRDFSTVIYQIMGQQPSSETASATRNQLTNGVITNPALLGSLAGCCSELRNFRIQDFDVRYGDFSEMTLENVVFNGNLVACQFIGAKLTNCKINGGAVNCTFTGATMSKETLFKGTLKGCVFGSGNSSSPSGTTILNVEFDANLEDCDFSTAVLSSVKFTGSAKETRFIGTHMTSCIFSSKKVTKSFWGSKVTPPPYQIVESSFNRATLSQVDFTNSQIQASTALETHFGHGVKFQSVSFLSNSVGAESKPFDVRNATYATSGVIFTPEQIRSLDNYQQKVAPLAKGAGGTRIHGAQEQGAIVSREDVEDEPPSRQSVPPTRNSSFNVRPVVGSEPRRLRGSQQVADMMRQNFAATRIEIRDKLANMVLAIDEAQGSEEAISLLRRSGNDSSGRGRSGLRALVAASQSAARASSNSDVTLEISGDGDIAKSKKIAGFKFMQDKLLKLTSLASCVEVQVNSLDSVFTTKSIAVKANMAYIAEAAKFTVLSLKEAKTVTCDTEYLDMVDQINSHIDSRISRLEAKSQKVQEALDDYGMIASECDKICSKADADIEAAKMIKGAETSKYKAQLKHTQNMAQLGDTYKKKIEELDKEIDEHNLTKKRAREDRDVSGRTLQSVTTEFVQEVSNFSLDIAHISEMLTAADDMQRSQVLISAFTVLTEAQNRQAEILRLQSFSGAQNSTPQVNDRIAELKFLQSTKLQKALAELESLNAEDTSSSNPVGNGRVSLRHSLQLSVGEALRSTRQQSTDADLSVHLSSGGGNYDVLSANLMGGIMECVAFFGANADPVEAMTQQHAKDITELRARFEEDIRRERTSHTEELARISAGHQQRLSELQKPITEMTAHMKLSYQQRVAELEERQKQALRVAETTHASKLSELKSQYEVERKFSFTSDSIIAEVKSTVASLNPSERVASSKASSAADKVLAVTGMLFKKINTAVEGQIKSMLSGTRVGQESVDQVFTAIAAGVDEAIGITDNQVLKNVLEQVKVYLKHYHSHLILVMQQKNEIAGKVHAVDAQLDRLQGTVREFNSETDSSVVANVKARIERLEEELLQLHSFAEGVLKKLQRLAESFTGETKKLSACITNFSTASSEEHSLIVLTVEGIQARGYFLYRQEKGEARRDTNSTHAAAVSGVNYEEDKALERIEDLQGRITDVLAKFASQVPPSTAKAPLPPPSTAKAPLPPPSTAKAPLPPPPAAKAPPPPPPAAKAPPPPPPAAKAPPPPPPAAKAPPPPPSSAGELSSSQQQEEVTPSVTQNICTMLNNVDKELTALTNSVYSDKSRSRPQTIQSIIAAAKNLAQTEIERTQVTMVDMSEQVVDKDGDDNSATARPTAKKAPLAEHLAKLQTKLTLGRETLKILRDQLNLAQSVKWLTVDSSKLTRAIDEVDAETKKLAADVGKMRELSPQVLGANPNLLGLNLIPKPVVIAVNKIAVVDGEPNLASIEQNFKVREQIVEDKLGEKYYASRMDAVSHSLRIFEVPKWTQNGYMEDNSLQTDEDCKRFSKELRSFANYLAANGNMELEEALSAVDSRLMRTASGGYKYRAQLDAKSYVETYLSKVAKNTEIELAARTALDEMEKLNKILNSPMAMPRNEVLNGMNVKTLKEKHEAISRQMEQLSEFTLTVQSAAVDLSQVARKANTMRKATPVTYNLAVIDVDDEEPLKVDPPVLGIILRYVDSANQRIISSLTIKYCKGEGKQRQITQSSSLPPNCIEKLNESLRRDNPQLSLEGALQEMFSDKANLDLLTQTLRIPKDVLEKCKKS